MTDIQRPTAKSIAVTRVAAGLTQEHCAERFGYTLRGWQQKETSGQNGRAIKRAEWELLLLLAGQHPEFTLQQRESTTTPPDKSPAQQE